MSSNCESDETLSPWLPSSPMIGPAIVTDSRAGITVMNGASIERKIRNSRMRMKTNAAPCTWLPVLPDCFCWSTLIASWPARCTCMPAGGPAAVMEERRFLTRSVIAPWSLCDTLDSTWICAACPATPCGPGTADSPSSRTFVTVGTLPRSVTRVPRNAWSAELNDPVDTAATTGTGVTESEMPSGAARFVACSLGALAGRNALLLPCVTLASDGNPFEMPTAATIQKITTTHRNLTANLPIPRKMSSTCTRQGYRYRSRALSHSQPALRFRLKSAQRGRMKRGRPDRRFATGGGVIAGLWGKMSGQEGESHETRDRYRTGRRPGSGGVLRRELGLPATAGDSRRQRRGLDPARPGRRAPARQQCPLRVRGRGGHRAARGDLRRRAADLPAGRRAARPGADRVDGRLRVQRPPGGALHTAARRHVRARLRGDAHERRARGGRPGAHRAAVHPVARAAPRRDDRRRGQGRDPGPRADDDLTDRQRRLD